MSEPIYHVTALHCGSLGLFAGYASRVAKNFVIRTSIPTGEFTGYVFDCARQVGNALPHTLVRPITITEITSSTHGA